MTTDRQTNREMDEQAEKNRAPPTFVGGAKLIMAWHKVNLQEIMIRHLANVVFQAMHCLKYNSEI